MSDFDSLMKVEASNGCLTLFPKATANTSPLYGYHTFDIPKGELGEFSKINEEVIELKDAINQNNKIMVLCELSDLYGAMEAFIAKYSNDSITMADIKTMSDATTRAFKVGER
jgi:NTP pyrophosphatase (non-canonical NTP hydrolase)